MKFWKLAYSFLTVLVRFENVRMETLSDGGVLQGLISFWLMT